MWQGAQRSNAAADPVRNGDRWRVAAIDPATGRVAAQRLTDHARAVFHADYLREHLTHGYATTVHSAQGVTADSTHAVLAETTSRSLLYVAMTRARDANTAYLYERANEQEYGPTPAGGPHVLHRGTSQEAGRLAQAITATHDDVPVTAHQVTANTPRQQLPDTVGRLLDRRSTAVGDRCTAYTDWRNTVTIGDPTWTRSRTHAADRACTRDRDDGMEL